MGKIKRILTPQEIKKRKHDEEHDRVVAQAKETACLRPMQKRLVAEILKNPGAPVIEQMRAAGYKAPEGSKPHHVKKRLEGKLGLTLREFGIFEDDLAKVAADGLQATNLKIIRVSKRDKDGRVIKEELKFIETPDYKTRLAYFIQLTKLGDYFPAKKVKHDGDFTHHVYGDVDPAILEQRKRDLLAKAEVQSDFEVVDA